MAYKVVPDVPQVEAHLADVQEADEIGGLQIDSQEFDKAILSHSQIVHHFEAASS